MLASGGGSGVAPCGAPAAMVATGFSMALSASPLPLIRLPGPARRLLLALLLVLPALLANAAARAAEAVTDGERRQVFPGSDAVGPVAGQPPVAPAMAKGAVIGWIFSTHAIVGSTGYSGQPLDILVGLDRDGIIKGTLLRRHAEPILVIGIDEADLARHVGAYAGLDVLARGRIGAGGRPAPAAGTDALAGATVTSAVIRDAILRAAKTVAQAQGLGGPAAAALRLDRSDAAPAAWPALIADGSLVGRRFSNAEVAARAGVPVADGVDPEGLFLGVTTGLLTPPRIGESLLGRRGFSRLIARLATDDQPLFIAADGRFSVKGTGFLQRGRFERLQLVQGTRTIALTTDGYENVERPLAEGAPEPREAGIFVAAAGSGFDPLQPWRLEVLVAAARSGGQPVVLAVDYRLPDRYRVAAAPAAMVPAGDAAADGVAGAATAPATAPATATTLATAPGDELPVWRQAWQDRRGNAVAAGILLMALTIILVFQGEVVADRRAYRRLRLFFLMVTLIWLGWGAGGQLSVVNVFTFSQALLSGFRWEFFLLDPVIFLLWSWVVVALLFWGRGVYCGWLCPFGALQELTSEVARRLRVPQLKVPFAVHERLWPIKYVIFLGLFAVSLHSVKDAFVLAEVEPFKTAITLRFLRDWPFVLYAGALLIAGLFIERFFCRYLCPLGAALAIPARLRMFDWLKRHPQCGRECAICFQRCPVQAIHPEGHINPNECIHCLNCQQLYWDDGICPPLVAARRRRERRAALSAGEAVMPERR